MHAKSILRLAPCDLKKLPIGALEAFVLSRVHADSVAEDVAEAAGLELGDLLRVAARLVELGALAVVGPDRKSKRPTVAPSRRRATVHPGKADSLVPVACVPKPRQAGDLRSLGIGPREGFVLSQIDGATSVSDLGEITGLSAADLSAALRALEGAGAVDLGSPRKRSSPAKRAATQKPPSPAPSPAPSKRAATQKPPAAAPSKRAATQKPPSPAPSPA
ncbi:MAG TPA: hypothetical protein VHS09_08000, partial [Polyangiaceae bacterium]|nr:hypothetical protein [Polyangiaceae bacterium]